jgi:hypothetical protein
MRAIPRWALTLAIAAAAARSAPAQEAPPSAPLAPAAPEKITLIAPAVDKDTATVTLPAAFWNQQMRSAIEVALCGRPSDFLHETILSVTTTQDLLTAALRDAGFHDADAWVASVHDFPRIRGDRMLILLTFERNHVVETFALDELLAFHNWNISAGPYGWMFKGDPEHSRPTTAPAKDPLTGEPLTDAGKILRDDPQIAVKLQAIQHVSQSFADSPLAYDDWVFPMMDLYRNTSVLPQAVFDSNGAVPVTLRIRKVTEEQFLEGVAAVWHDAAFRDYLAAQLPIARQIDTDKNTLWGLVAQLKKLPRESVTEAPLFGKVAATAAQVEKGYAALDSAWASWAADHAAFDAKSADFGLLKREAKLWKEHGLLMKERAAQLAIAEQAALNQRDRAAANAPPDELRKIRGAEIAARSAALLAEIKQPLDKWTDELQHLAPDDPREFWVKGIRLQVELLNAQKESGESGIAYGKALEAAAAPAAIAPLQSRWARAQLSVSIASLQVQLADNAFELSKREGIDNDPDIPALKARQADLESRLTAARAATQPAR